MWMRLPQALPRRAQMGPRAAARGVGLLWEGVVGLEELSIGKRSEASLEAVLMAKACCQVLQGSPRAAWAWAGHCAGFSTFIRQPPVEASFFSSFPCSILIPSLYVFNQRLASNSLVVLVVTSGIFNTWLHQKVQI